MKLPPLQTVTCLDETWTGPALRGALGPLVREEGAARAVEADLGGALLQVLPRGARPAGLRVARSLLETRAAARRAPIRRRLLHPPQPIIKYDETCVLRIISYRTISYRMTSNYIISCHVISYNII